MRNLLLLFMVIAAFFIANSAQASDLKDMSAYLKLANLNRDTSVTLNQRVSFNNKLVSIEEVEVESLENWTYSNKETEDSI